MTRPVLKALSLGGGALATWLAVAPSGGVRPSVPAAVPTPAAREQAAGDASAQADRLLLRTRAVTQRGSTRNPFRFGSHRMTAPTGQRADFSANPLVAVPALPAAPPPPTLTLSGVAEKKAPDGVRRMAVIAGDSQIYLVGVGDAVAGRYTVASVEPESVVLRDATGFELRLTFR